VPWVGKAQTSTDVTNMIEIRVFMKHVCMSSVMCLAYKVQWCRVFADGKYLVLPSGELHIRDVGPEDGYKSYQCRTKHRLTGETRLSATKGRLVITGESTI
jgi:hypothetical protein